MNSREYTESSIYSRRTCEDWIKAEVLCYVLKGHGGDPNTIRMGGSYAYQIHTGQSGLQGAGRP